MKYYSESICVKTLCGGC